MLEREAPVRTSSQAFIYTRAHKIEACEPFIDEPPKMNVQHFLNRKACAKFVESERSDESHVKNVVCSHMNLVTCI